jgi:UDPglucose 6-dehydrogenase
VNISIAGSGYVGLITAAGFASNGHKVICIDTDENKVNQINHGVSPFYEVDFDSLLSSCVNLKRSLKASADYQEISRSDITFICVNTPNNSEKDIDISHIIDSTTEIGLVLAKKNGYHIVVIKSTVSPGTTEAIVIPILEKCSFKKAGTDFGIAVNPEFLQEGRAVHCFFNPDRIIIGEYDCRTGDILEEIYQDSLAPIIRTDIRTAEMIKHASNAFLATKISFINEIGNICKKLGIDVYEVAKAMSLDHRISPHFLEAGLGFGGSCLPKDTRALIGIAEALGYEPQLLQAVLEVNRKQPLRMVELAKAKMGNLRGKRLAILGTAFKPHTNDIRGSLAIPIIEELLKDGAIPIIYDPKALENTRKLLGERVLYSNNAEEAVAKSDCILIVTDWDELKDGELYRGKVVIDGRRTLLEKQDMNYERVC